MSKNILNKTRNYLIGNLQCADFTEIKNWRDDYSQKVKPMGVITMSPLDKIFINFEQEGEKYRQQMFDLLAEGKLAEVHKSMQLIRRRDLAMVDHSTFITGVLDISNPTYGTIEELSFATRANKPIFLVIKQGIKKVPLWIAAMMKPTSFYNSIEEVVEKLKKINDGTESISDDQWRIFEDKYNTIS